MRDVDVRKTEATAPSVESFKWPENSKQMRDALAFQFEKMGFEVTDVELECIVNTPAFRNVFIASIYNTERANGEKAEYLYCRLGEVFGIGSKAIRYIIQSRRKHCANLRNKRG